MKKKKKCYLIPIIVILILAIIFLSSELLSIYKLGLTKICVAKMSIPQRTEIIEEYIDYVFVPKGYINENTYTDENDVIGKYVKLDSYIPKGSLFYKDNLEKKDDIKDLLHLELNNDEVTYDLFIKDIKVNPAHLLKGMKVNLYLTVKGKEVFSDLLLSGTRIIGLYDVNNNEIKNTRSDYSLGTISIAVKKEYVPVINKAIVIGDVSLIVGNDLYDDKEMSLNSKSEIFNLLK